VSVARRRKAEAREGVEVGILTADMQRVVERELGFVATVRPDGAPNLSPKGTIAVWDDDHLVFADLRSPGTIENLGWNPRVEVNVVDQLSRKGYRLEGSAVVHTEGAEFDRGIEFYERRGLASARERIRSIVVIAVERAAPVTSPAYDLGATEDELRAIHRERLLS